MSWEKRAVVRKQLFSGKKQNMNCKGEYDDLGEDWLVKNWEMYIHLNFTLPDPGAPAAFRELKEMIEARKTPDYKGGAKGGVARPIQPRSLGSLELKKLQELLPAYEKKLKEWWKKKDIGQVGHALSDQMAASTDDLKDHVTRTSEDLQTRIKEAVEKVSSASKDEKKSKPILFLPVEGGGRVQNAEGYFVPLQVSEGDAVEDSFTQRYVRVTVLRKNMNNTMIVSLEDEEDQLLLCTEDTKLLVSNPDCVGMRVKTKPVNKKKTKTGTIMQNPNDPTGGDDDVFRVHWDDCQRPQKVRKGTFIILQDDDHEESLDPEAFFQAKGKNGQKGLIMPATGHRRILRANASRQERELCMKREASSQRSSRDCVIIIQDDDPEESLDPEAVFQAKGKNGQKGLIMPVTGHGQILRADAPGRKRELYTKREASSQRSSRDRVPRNCLIA